MAEDGAYGGLVGAFPYAFRRSGSWLFRSYVVVSALAGLYVALLLVLGAIAWIASPGLLGEKSLLGVIGLLVLMPLFAPVLVVARRYRLEVERPATDWLFGLVGYGFLAALYVGVFITDPSEHDAGGFVGLVFATLDGIPAIYGLVPPAVAALAIYLVIRWTRRRDPES